MVDFPGCELCDVQIMYILIGIVVSRKLETPETIMVQRRQTP